MKRLLLLMVLAGQAVLATPAAIIFDFGGVFIHPNRQPLLDFITAEFALDEEGCKMVFEEYRTGIAEGIEETLVWEAISLAHSRPFDWYPRYLMAVERAIGVDPQMFALAKELKEEGYLVGLLSNIKPQYAKTLRQFGLYELFEPCLLSCDLGLEKPDPQIYQELLDTLGLPATEIVFIDDRVENVEAAKAVGIYAIHFTSREELQMALKKRGGEITPLLSMHFG